MATSEIVLPSSETFTLIDMTGFTQLLIENSEPTDIFYKFGNNPTVRGFKLDPGHARLMDDPDLLGIYVRASTNGSLSGVLTLNKVT